MRVQRVFVHFIGVSAIGVLTAAQVGCAPWRSGNFSHLSRTFRTREVHAIAVTVDAGEQSRISAAQIMSAIRLMLLYRGYRPVILPVTADPLTAARLHGADALLSVTCTLHWQTIRVQRGQPSYPYRADIPRVAVEAKLSDLSGKTLLRGRFRAQGAEASTPPHMQRGFAAAPRYIRLEDEWSLIAKGLAHALRALPVHDEPMGQVRRLRLVRVILAPDEEYRRQAYWEPRALAQIAGASRILEIEFGIRLRVVGIHPWASSDRPQSLERQFASMLRQVQIDSADIIVGFTAQENIRDRTGKGRVGISRPFGSALLLHQAKVREHLPALADVFGGAMLAREVVHLFGVPRQFEPGASLTFDDPNALLGFDERTRRIIALTKYRSFAERGRLNVPVDSLAVIYRQAGPEGAIMLEALRAHMASPEREMFQLPQK